jgi:hypothetical protein
MRLVITSKEEFENKVHCSNGGMLLLFHSNSSSQSDLNDYVEEAEDKCGSDYRVYTINIDDVWLSKADVAKYQSGVTVICCTVLMDDSVAYQEVNPDPAVLRHNISC